MLDYLATRVEEVYAQADEAVSRFAAASGLSCPPGCCSCCLSEQVEATTLEMLPLAFHLFRTRQAELMLKRLEKQQGSNRCLLFRPERSDAGGGACSQYPYRALICRLFGFAGSNDRNGRPRLAYCRIMKQQKPALGVRQPPDTTAEQLPLFHDFGMAITTLHPHLGTNRLPINLAIKEALLKVGLILELNPPVAKPVSTDLPPEKPLGTPFQPRRAA